MKKWIAGLALSALLGLQSQVLAFGHTTVLAQDFKSGKAGGSVPYVDGMKEDYLQKNVNSLLHTRAEELARKAGGNAVVSYTVTVNRPTLFSVVMKASGDRTVYDGMNIDVAAGAELEPKELLYTNTAEYQQYIGSRHYVFSEEGIAVQSAADGPFDKVVPYRSIVSMINVAGGARLLTSYKLTKESQDKTLSLRAGELIALYLDSNPASGMDWVLTDRSAAPGFRDLGHSFYMPMVNKTGRGGTPGQTIMFLAFDRPGTYTVEAVYKRRMEKSPYNELNFHFDVH